MKRTFTTTLMTLLLCVCIVFGLTACGGFTQDDIDNAVNDATAPLKEQITELEADIAEKEAKITALEGEKTALTTEKGDLEAEIEEIEAEVAALESEKAALEAEVAALEEEKATLTADKAALEASILAKYAEITNLNSSIDTLTEEKQALTDKVAELEDENKKLEEKIEAIKNYCVSGNHNFAGYEYKFSEDLTTVDKNAMCLNCDMAYETETAATVLEDHTLTATFAGDDIKVWDITDGTVLTADQLRTTVSYLLSTGERKLDITLPAEADIDKLLAIREVLVKWEGARGEISLTLRGITEIPDYSFDDRDKGLNSWGKGIFGDWNTAEGIEIVRVLGSVTLTDAVYIGNNAFCYCPYLSYFSAPLAIEVGVEAFHSSWFSEVYLPLVETVGESAFEWSDLGEISLPSAKVIGEEAFACSDLGEISLPSAKEIGDNAFMACDNLSKVYLPSATTIGYNAFLFCEGLTELTLGNLELVDHASNGIFDGVDTGSINLIIPCTQKTLILDDDNFWTPTDALYRESEDYTNGVFMSYTFKSVSFSHESDEYEYTLSADLTVATRSGICLICSAEYDVKTSTIVYADGKATATFLDGDVKTLDIDHIDGTVLTADQLHATVSLLLSTGERKLDIILPAEADVDKLVAIRKAIVRTEGVDNGSVSLTLRGITEIPNYSLYDEDTYSLGDGIFGFWFVNGNEEECLNELCSVTLTDAVYIGNDAFCYCSYLSYFSAPLAIEVGVKAFYYSCISEVYLPLVETVGESAFAQGDLGEISLPSAKVIGEEAFAYGDLGEISLPSAKVIGESAFAQSDLGEISLPSAKVIGEEAFAHCDNLSKIYMPSATTIESHAFRGCEGLTELTIGKIESIDNFILMDIFEDIDTRSIDLIISCAQKELIPGDDFCWIPTDTPYSESDAYANSDFLCFTYKSVSISHELKYTVNDGEHTAECLLCDHTVTEIHAYNEDGECACGATANAK